MFNKDFKNCSLACVLTACATAHVATVQAQDAPDYKVNNLASSLSQGSERASQKEASTASSSGYNFFAAANAQAMRQQTDSAADERSSSAATISGASSSKSGTVIAWLIGTLLLSTLMLSRNSAEKP